MTIGVGWGRTLSSTLQHIGARPLNDLKVISLLGGIVQPRRSNPPEFAWQFAQIFQGEGYLIPAPALVDSKETRIALIERCGLNTVLDMAEELDMVLLSVGDIQTASSTSYRVGLIDEAQKLSSSKTAPLATCCSISMTRTARSSMIRSMIVSCRRRSKVYKKDAAAYPHVRRKREDCSPAWRDKASEADRSHHR